MEATVESIRTSPYQPRLLFELEELKESIKQDSMLVPILAREKRDGETNYEIIDGERRWRVAKELNWQKVPLELRNVDDETARRMVYILNEERQPYTLEENTKFFRRMYDQMGSVYAVSQAFKRPQSTIWNYINVSVLPEHFQKAIWGRKIPMNVIKEMEPVFTQARDEIGDITSPVKYQDSPSYQKLLAWCERVYTGEIKTPEELGKEYVDPYLEALDKARITKAKEELEKIVPSDLIEATVKMETPEDYERAAEVLEKEARKQREEAMTPQERAAREAEAQARAEARAKRAEERQQREEEERRRLEEEAREKATQEFFENPALFKQAREHFAELKRREREARLKALQVPMPMPSTEADMVHKVVIGDAKEVLQLLLPSSVDLVVTSPPYFGLKDYGHDLGMNITSLDAYLTDLKEIFTKCFRVLKDGTFICVVVGQFTSNNGSYFIPGHVSRILEEIGFRYRREHIWMKPLGVQGIWNRGTTSFLYEPWPRNTMINIHHEHILVYQKGEKPTIFEGRNPLTEDEVKEYCWSVWQLVPSDIKEHPAPFPPAIPERLIKMYSYEGEIVLDPFLGAGTTIKEAKTLNRRSIGIEVSPEYLALIQKTIGGADIIRFDEGETPDFNYLATPKA